MYEQYRVGRKPILRELTEDGVGIVYVNSNSSISIDLLAELLDRMLAVITELDEEDTITTENFYFPDEWESMSNGLRRLLGMGVVFLVTTGRVPLTCVNPTHSGTKKYRVSAL